MELQEATRQADAHLKNAQELAGRPVGKEELLYMWDNQITALDNFLADTESVPDASFKAKRAEIREVKKRLTDAVVAFEAAAAGEEVAKDEPTKEEWVEAYLEQAQDMVTLAKEALGEKVKSVQDLVKWEEPLAVMNGYLADSEPYQEQNRDLRKARSVVRMARKELKGAIDDVFLKWKAADRASGAEGDDDDE
ncbi:MAG TPA: hypothetical protein VM286_02935 [Candidatus Thermoplasmatota archaeon]|nr:hypothetical protein [Candidatus Thermoplasmatota archaeon]